MYRRVVVSAVLAVVAAACTGESKIAEPRLQPGGRVRVASAVGTDPVTGATIETNQNDYMPGEIVHVNGSGWAPNETVNLYLSESPDTHEDVSMDVQADSAGTFSVHFYDVQTYDIGVQFTLTATGRASGSKAVATFTDGNIAFTTNPANLVASVSYDRFNGSASCVGNPSSTGNTLAYNTNVGLNDGQSILITIPTVAGRTFTGVTAGSLTIEQPSTTTLCVSGSGGGTQLGFVLNFSASAQATTTTVASGTNPSVTGEGVTFTATVKVGATAVTTGSVTFKLGGTTCADAPTTVSGPTALDGSGNATSSSRTFNATETGAVVRACYGGSSGFDASEGSVTQTVNKAATQTALADVPTSSSVGQAVTFTPSVSVQSPGAGTATGTVNLYELSGVQTCAALGGATLLGTGTAGSGIVVSSLAAGAHTITACYLGDNNFSASSGTDTHSVDLIVTNTSVTSSVNPSVTGQSVTFTATVKAAASPIGAQGNVVFKVGGTTCATATTVLATVALDASGQAQTSTSFLASASPNSVVACYGGNATYATSEGAIAQTTNPAVTTTTLVGAPNPSTYGQTVTFTATVAVSSPGGGTAGGSVSFYKFAAGGSCGAPNGTLLGSGTLAGGSASVTYNALPAVTNTITACYAGNADYSGSNGTTAQVVGPATVTITASSGTKTFGTTYTVTPSYAGFVLGQNESVLTTAPTCSSAGSVAGATVGPYTTSCSGAAAANYTFQYVSGSLVVTAAVTTLTLADPATTQYSDKIKLSASVSPTSLAGSDQSGSVEFFINGTSVGTAPLVSGTATKSDIANGRVAGSYTVSAMFTSSNVNFGNDSDGSKNLTITAEDATIVPDGGNAGAINVSLTTFTLNFAVKETAPEPTPNPDPDSRAVPGNIGLAGNFTAKITGISTNSMYSATCAPTGVTGSPPTYAATRTFACVFAGGPFMVDAYTMDLKVDNGYYYGADEDALTVFNPADGFVTGGGKFLLDGQRVSFGLSFTYQKGKTTPRGGLVIVRHHADGGRCRVKSNSMDAPAVSGTTASFSGKGNYSCVDGTGATTASAGNLSLTGYVEDNGTSGIAQDKFWIRAYGELLMALQAPANAVLLTGGNIQVPQPSGK